MSDPKRLLAGRPSDLERALLEAVSGEQPSERQRQRVRRALGLGKVAIIGGAAASTAVARAATLVSAMKVAGGVLVAALVGGTVWWAQTGRSRAHAASDAAAALSQPTRAVTVWHMAGETGASLGAADTEDRSATSSLTQAVAPAGAPPSEVHGDSAPVPRPRRSNPPTRVTRRSSSDMREQIRLLDLARASAARHDSAAALRSLDAYDARFPGGAFEQEALVLRMEALEQRGEHERAASLARAFLAKHPSSPHVARVLRIAGAPTR